MVFKNFLEHRLESYTGLTVALDAVIAKDNITYERKAIERWFQLKKHSPATGLDLQDTTVQYNQLMMNRVTNWIEGEDITGASSQSAKRPRPSSPADPEVEIQFHGPLGSFVRRVTPLLSVADLYKLVFRGMRGVHEHFDLHYNNQILDAFGNTIQSQNIGNGAIILVSVHGNPPNAKEKSSGEAELEELCLVKVYENYRAAHFSYWVPKRTTQSLASVIFRYWRYNQENNLFFKSHDRDVWTKVVETGDGHKGGHIENHWSSLAHFFTPFYAKGSLVEEDIFATTTSTTRDGTNTKRKWDLESANTDPTVLKLNLLFHRPERDRELRAKQERNNLSRVDNDCLLRELQLTSDLSVECLQTNIRVFHQQDTSI